MIFEKEAVAFNILDVIELNQNETKMYNYGRNFDALSFRFKAETLLETESKTYDLTDNSVCYVPSRVDYTRTSKTDRLIVIHFNSLSYHSKEIECFYPKHPEIYAELFKKILLCWKAKDISYKHKCSALLYEIFSEFYKENQKKQKINPLIEKSVTFLKENYKSPDISVKEAAKKSNISEVYFRKLFKEEFGISPRKYIISSRLKYAEGLIATGYYSLQEVAFMSGFTDYKYFSAEFKRKMGVSPSKYTYNYSE